MALVGINQPSRKTKKSALEIVMDGLNVAANLANTAKNVGIITTEADDAATRLKQAEADTLERQNRGEITDLEAAKAGYLRVPGLSAPNQKTEFAQKNPLISAPEIALSPPKTKTSTSFKMAGGGTGEFYNPEKEREYAKDQNALAQDYSTHPITKNTQLVAQSYSKIKEVTQNPSPAGDMTLVFNYIKMLDPGSTVREGEYATAQNTTGVSGTILRAYNAALNGESLLPEQRNDFLNQANRIFKSQIKIQKTIDEQYQNSAKSLGGSGDFVRDYESVVGSSTTKNQPSRKTNKSDDLNEMNIPELEKLLKEMRESRGK